MKDREKQAVEQFSSIVCSIARSAYNGSAVIDVDDLKQIGYIAVVECVRRFDVSAGGSFRNYVRQSVRRAIFRETKKFLLFFRLPHDIYDLTSKAGELAALGNDTTAISKALNERYPNTDRSLDEEFVEKLLILCDLRKGKIGA